MAKLNNQGAANGLLLYASGDGGGQIMGSTSALGVFIFFAPEAIKAASVTLPDGRVTIGGEQIYFEWAMIEIPDLAPNQNIKLTWFEHDYDAHNEWARIQRMYENYYSRQNAEYQ